MIGPTPPLLHQPGGRTQSLVQRPNAYLQPVHGGPDVVSLQIKYSQVIVLLTKRATTYTKSSAALEVGTVNVPEADSAVCSGCDERLRLQRTDLEY